MNNVLIYFCANVQILIRPGTIVFTKSDLTPGEKRRISLRFDRTPDVSPIFLQDSTAHPTRAPYFSKIRPRTRREVPHFSKIRPRTRCTPRIFREFHHAPAARWNISLRFRFAPDVSPVFSQDSTFHLPRGRIREKHGGSQSYINRFVVPLASVKQIMDLNQ